MTLGASLGRLRWARRCSLQTKTRWFLALCPLLVGFDFWSKEAARGMEMYATIPVVPGWFAFTHHENPFIAFSIPVPYAAIVAVALVGVAAMIWQLTKLAPDARLQASGLAAMAAGAAGNLVDRLADGTVTDMFMIYTEHAALKPWLVSTFGTATWPIFNVADVALLGGVVAYLAGSAWEAEEDDVLLPATPD